MYAFHRFIQKPLKHYQSIFSLHTSSNLSAWKGEKSGPKKWLLYNEKVYSPQAPDEESRPAVIKVTIITNIHITFIFYISVCLPSAH